MQGVATERVAEEVWKKRALESPGCLVGLNCSSFSLCLAGSSLSLMPLLKMLLITHLNSTPTQNSLYDFLTYLSCLLAQFKMICLPVIDLFASSSSECKLPG